MNAKTFVVDQADDPILFRALNQRPSVAWPTIILFIAAFAIFGLSTAAHIEGELSLFWTILINSIACYLSFTVVHDATHGSVTSHRKVNDWLGRISTALLSPIPFFRTFRYIHLQHHSFTNDEAQDPDLYVGRGPRWLLPLKWVTLDLYYFYFYLTPKRFMGRPKSERRELFIATLFGGLVFTAVTVAGWLHYYLFLFLIPTRFANLFLAVTFDFLPHYPHQAKAKDEPFQCTSNRVGMEWLLTPVLLSQNYHLVHHLYPGVPFYRILRVWKAKSNYHQSQNPATVDAFALKPRAQD